MMSWFKINTVLINISIPIQTNMPQFQKLLCREDSLNPCSETFEFSALLCLRIAKLWVIDKKKEGVSNVMLNIIPFHLM